MPEYYLQKGMTLYHKTNRTKSTIKEIDDKNITIELSREISNKKTLILPITHIGEWLFFNEHEIDLPLDSLIRLPQYIKYGNEKLLELYNLRNQSKGAIEKAKNRITKDEINKFKIMVNELKEKYRFQGLWHFTDFTNLQSIFDAGELLSRKMCIDNNMTFLDGANHDVVNRANEFVHSCTRFYYRPKTPTLYDNEGIKPIDYSNRVHIPRPVYLLFSEDIIYDNDTMFSNGNATNSSIGNTVEFFREMDWDSIFHSTWFLPEERDYIVNKRHAELLSKTPVSLKYLTNIIFRSEADLYQAIRLLGKNVKFIVNENYFSDKNNLSITDWRYNNYIKDYRVECLLNKLLITISFKKPVRNYLISWGIEDSRGNSKTNLIKDGLSVRFSNEFNNEVNELQNAINVKLIFNYMPLDGDIIKIYLNNVLCIEETVIKQRRS